MNDALTMEVPVAKMLTLLPRSDRYALIERHQRKTVDYVPTWDEEEEEEFLKPIPLPEPLCSGCGEVWGEYGCRTIRALAVIGANERIAKEASRRNAELTEALTPRFGVSRLREPGNTTVELRMHVDRHTLIYAREWRAWFKNVGHLQRIRADASYALTLDSQHYAFLTQEFDPTASFEKLPNAPWATVPWEDREQPQTELTDRVTFCVVKANCAGPSIIRDTRHGQDIWQCRSCGGSAEFSKGQAPLKDKREAGR